MYVKYLGFCLLFFLLGTAPKEDTILWNSKKLTWTDFKADPNPNSDAVALTASGITFGQSIKTLGGRIIGFSTTVEAFFYPNQSWYVKDRADDFTLRHEQLHFDITELFARKFRQQITKLRANPKIREQLRTLHASINKALDETQKLYDAQTHHSINEDAQNEWENHIQAELKKLDNFKLR